MGDYGLKITKPGFDVASAAIVDQGFNSSVANTLKIHTQGSTTITIGSGATSASATINHNLGRIPLVMVFGELNSGSKWFNDMTTQDISDYMSLLCRATSSDLIIQFGRTSSSSTWSGAVTRTFNYFIFVEQAA